MDDVVQFDEGSLNLTALIKLNYSTWALMTLKDKKCGAWPEFVL